MDMAPLSLEGFVCLMVKSQFKNISYILNIANY